MSRLLKFYPPLDVSDPEVFVAGLVTLFAQYPTELMTAAIDPHGVPTRVRTLNSLAVIKQVCDEIYAPIARRLERERIARQARALPRPPRTQEEQDRIDAQVARWKRPPLEEGS